MTSGVFFDRCAACAWTATATYQSVVGQQLLPALGDGVGIQAGGFGDGAVAPVSEPESLESREEPALALVEQAHEEHDCGLGFVRCRGRLQRSGKGAAGPFGALTDDELMLARHPFGRAVDVPPGDLLPGETPEPYQREKRILRLHLQLDGEFRDEVAAR